MFYSFTLLLFFHHWFLRGRKPFTQNEADVIQWNALSFYTRWEFSTISHHLLMCGIFFPVIRSLKVTKQTETDESLYKRDQSALWWWFRGASAKIDRIHCTLTFLSYLFSCCFFFFYLFPNAMNLIGAHFMEHVWLLFFISHSAYAYGY